MKNTAENQYYEMTVGAVTPIEKFNGGKGANQTHVNRYDYWSARKQVINNSDGKCVCTLVVIVVFSVALFRAFVYHHTQSNLTQRRAMLLAPFEISNCVLVSILFFLQIEKALIGFSIGLAAI